MVIVKSKSPISFILYSAIVVTLIATPMWNKDALIIPKVALLFFASIFLLPYFILDHRILLKSKITKIFVITMLLILVQYILIIGRSTSPIEQQIFGRTGRGIGLITLVSLICITFASKVYIQYNEIDKINKSFALTGVVLAIYGILQSYSLDPLAWETKNNGVIGTLGNPNFQSSFLAMSLVPILILSIKLKNKLIISPLLISLMCFAIYRAQSTQGYIGAVLAFSIFGIIFLWFKNRYVSFVLFFIFMGSSIIAIIGMLNKGPLAAYLYKVSIQSRGDFWRSSIRAINDNPLSGVGLDSFGDYYLKYRDLVAVNHTFAEFTDSSHNYLLDYAATGGYLLLILNLILIILGLYSFYKVQKSINHFHGGLTSVFCIFTVFQAQSLISPNNISLMLWNAIIIGSIIGIASQLDEKNNVSKNLKSFSIINPFSLIALFVGIIAIFPYFNADRLQLQAMQKGDGNLAIKSSTMYPESVVRYSTMSRELYNSGLKIESLELARSGVKFNPYSASLWALILVNTEAPLAERKIAQTKLMTLDPLNKEVKNYFIEP